MSSEFCLGIIGAGQLGRSIAHGLLSSQLIAPENLWISSRSLRPDNALSVGDSQKVHRTIRNQDLIEHCDMVIIAVPPHLSAALAINTQDTDCLVVSVMAGVTVAQLLSLSGSRRVIRAMSNPAAEKGLAYTPWFASPEVTVDDRALARRVFEAIGQTDEVFDEQQIDQFTGLIGPVPGFVAYYADCMVQYAVNNGIEPPIAERAIRQLFHASGVLLADSEASPKAHVEEMINYDGTTAAGLRSMQASPLSASIDEGLQAAFDKSLEIG
ncbi:pyrroline-5-carboxylate reductase [Amphritea opalescens]|uniref:Pyrroline-5-carboxylate reductase n=1 Tax=Amphritea opalescens TaxID=2490544 RepID=A0A430KVV3_9GAMM|nr:pyrroline-5-carboxylate reductase dimerization domain-containing protein [Amphritea opalescens]RTE67494.1 pyrroline-5-carboxylate reductase [Amphritea opalescens]